MFAEDLQVSEGWPTKHGVFPEWTRRRLKEILDKMEVCD